MADPQRRRPDWGPGAKMVTDGMLAAQANMVDDAATVMLRGAPTATRFVLKRIPGAPGLVYDLAELGQTKNKTRKVFSMIGGAVGGTAGGALGVATGPAAPVAAPIGAAVGSVAGQQIAEDFYDDHEAAVDRVLDGSADSIRRGIDATKAWIRKRDNHVAGTPAARR